MKFAVYAVATVSLFKEIEADSKEQAQEIAEGLALPMPSHQAYGRKGHDDGTWDVDAELGEAFDIEVNE